MYRSNILYNIFCTNYKFLEPKCNCINDQQYQIHYQIQCQIFSGWYFKFIFRFPAAVHRTTLFPWPWRRRTRSPARRPGSLTPSPSHRCRRPPSSRPRPSSHSFNSLTSRHKGITMDSLSQIQVKQTSKNVKDRS